MNIDFDRAVQYVLEREGGADGELVGHDKGGYTKFGISSAGNPDVNVQELTREGAVDIYRKRYWDACRCDELPSPLAIAVFDAAVNQGVKPAGKMLQIAIGSVGVDGVIGEGTITAAHKSDGGLLRRFLAQRMARYVRTVMKDITQDAFTENWSDRLMRCAQLVFVGGPVK